MFPVLPEDEWIEVHAGKATDLEPWLQVREPSQRVRAKIIQVLRHDVSVLGTEQANRKRLRVRSQDQAVSPDLQNLRGFGEKSSRFGQMFHDSPKRDRVKTLVSEFVGRKGAVNYLNPFGR